MMKNMITISILFLVLFSTNVFAKDWYEKKCKPTQKDKNGNYYVGGPGNKYHLHVGSDFMSNFSKNNKSKMVAKGKENCDSITTAIKDVGGGGYETPADVTACLVAAKSQFDCR